MGSRQLRCVADMHGGRREKKARKNNYAREACPLPSATVVVMVLDGCGASLPTAVSSLALQGEGRLVERDQHEKGENIGIYQYPSLRKWRLASSAPCLVLWARAHDRLGMERM